MAGRIRRYLQCDVSSLGRSPSPRGKDKRIDSPTPATDPDRGKPKTVGGITAGDQRVKVRHYLGGGKNNTAEPHFATT